MLALFFQFINNDILLFILLSIATVLFRIIFIAKYNRQIFWKQPYLVLKSIWYGYKWGLDINAFCLPILFLSSTLPIILFPNQINLLITIKSIVWAICLSILYIGFCGQMIFYKEFRDIFNSRLMIAKKANKKNLIEIFFKEHSGFVQLLILGIVLLGSIYSGIILQAYIIDSYTIKIIKYPLIIQLLLIGISVVCVGVVTIFLRYGFNIKRSKKPTRDYISRLFKENPFLVKATCDPLIALKLVKKANKSIALYNSKEILVKSIQHIVPEPYKENWEQLDNLLYAFEHRSQEHIIKNVDHIFLIVAESLTQWTMDEPLTELALTPYTLQFAQEESSLYIDKCIASANTSRRSLGSLLSGLFDGNLDLSDCKRFYSPEILAPFALGRQMKSLGYETNYWYGGYLEHGNFDKFAISMGFDKAISAFDLLGNDAPHTSIGVYDKIYLDAIYDVFKEKENKTFNVVYTTSNHGPFTIKEALESFNPSVDMPYIEDKIRYNKDEKGAFATCKYSDKAIYEFIKGIQDIYPNTLFILTGDHTHIFGDFEYSKLMPRKHTLRERYCTPLIFHHPELAVIKPTVTVPCATHFQILPTLMELVAPKDTIYYSLWESIFTQSMRIGLTPYNWITSTEIGSLESYECESNDVGEYQKEITHKEVDYTSLAMKAMDYINLSVWMMKYHK